MNFFKYLWHEISTDFLHWAGHPLWAVFVTLAFAPLFVWLGIMYWLPVMGLIFGLVHEGLQEFFDWVHPGGSWTDVADFTIGGVVASALVWCVIWSI